MIFMFFIIKELTCSDLIVMSLSSQTSEADVRKYFEKFGHLVRCEVNL